MACRVGTAANSGAQAFLMGLPDQIQPSESFQCSVYVQTRCMVRSQISGVLGLRLSQGLLGRWVRTCGPRGRTWTPPPFLLLRSAQVKVVYPCTCFRDCTLLTRGAL